MIRKNSTPKAELSASKIAKNTVSSSGMNAAAGNAAGNIVGSYKKGGMIKKAGLAKVHKGEKVIPRKDVKRVNKAIRKQGGKR